ncbi:hypothetical protein HPB50_006228 [Hyalomma asiaticum]|uniref:Uncharacterized protein n=1 Tax=Hyalomma asiaticum TaxID=266040 RepID=A0ACB7SD20_HYAAI|nr:hypothetical protein HPB50_006228 [Hyalomma asiaticum]
MVAHLIEAKEAPLSRWKNGRLNQSLRERIGDFQRAMAEYFQTLEKQHTNEVSNVVGWQGRESGEELVNANELAHTRAQGLSEGGAARLGLETGLVREETLSPF